MSGTSSPPPAHGSPPPAHGSVAASAQARAHVRFDMCVRRDDDRRWVVDSSIVSMSPGITDDLSDADSDQAEHHREAQGNTGDVRHRSRESVLDARRQQHGVVGAGSYRRDECLSSEGRHGVDVRGVRIAPEVE